MQFDLDNLNPGSWFEFGDARVCMRICAGKDLENIHKKTRKRRVEYRRGQRFEWQDIDEDQEFKLIYDFVIVDWENINDANGNPLQCNTTNKVKLLNGSPVFNRFIAESLERLGLDLAQVKEDEEKNLSDG